MKVWLLALLEFEKTVSLSQSIGVIAQREKKEKWHVSKCHDCARMQRTSLNGDAASSNVFQLEQLFHMDKIGVNCYKFLFF
ncbi:hypothetical protein EMIT0P253_70108 [Pseudomonas sp. IT-P253]